MDADGKINGSRIYLPDDFKTFVKAVYAVVDSISSISFKETREELKKIGMKTYTSFSKIYQVSVIPIIFIRSLRLQLRLRAFILFSPVTAPSLKDCKFSSGTTI